MEGAKSKEDGRIADAPEGVRHLTFKSEEHSAG
jgi:hypothetical protein